MKTIGANIKKIRKEKNLVQGELGKLSGLNQVYISRMENDEFIPTLNTLKRLANALGCKIDDLIDTG